MRALILAAGAALTLSACADGTEEATAENNTMAVETLEVGNVIMNDANAMNGMDANMMAGNVTMDANTMGADNMTGATGTETTNTETTTNTL